MQPGFAGAHGRLRLGPDFSLDAAAADGSRYLSILEEEHFRTALLGSRATGMRDRGHHHPLAAASRVIDEAIHVALGNA